MVASGQTLSSLVLRDEWELTLESSLIVKLSILFSVYFLYDSANILYLIFIDVPRLYPFIPM